MLRHLSVWPDFVVSTTRCLSISLLTLYFEGHQDMPYKEEVIPNPLNVYGTSKWEGEQRISSTWHKHYIIRTSWLYSIYPPNFVHSVLRLAKERNKLTVVADQQGIPTYAPDLAAMLLLVLESKHLPFGIYHYANKALPLGILLLLLF